jgi:rRNA-processing protein FCF1
MSTKLSPAISPEVMAELEEAAERAARGIRDPEAMKAACKRMDRMREETRLEHGTVNVAVSMIREGRDEG